MRYHSFVVIPLIAIGAAICAATAVAQHLLPGPGQVGENPALTQLARRYDRQFHTFNAFRFGLSLDNHIGDQSDRDLVAGFLNQNAEQDFLAFTTNLGTPRSLMDITDALGEHGDLGMFAGVPAAADAFRYMVLRDSSADQRLIDAARDDLLDAIEGFHIYANITGEPGTIARGIRLGDDFEDPVEDFPESCPHPWDWNDHTWRRDASGDYPDYRFLDNTSKDQLLGYVFAIGAFWDAVAQDPTIPDQVRLDLQADARAMAASLMEVVEISPGKSLDLVIRGTRGCITRFHDLNPREINSDPPVLLGQDSNLRIGFNALASLGIIRTLYHIAGDQHIGDYYYNELVANRDYPAILTTGLGRLNVMFINVCALGTCQVTNFSNVNMAFVAIYPLLRYETDATLLATYRAALESDLWQGNKPHMGSAVQQAFFNVIYAGLRQDASDVAAADSAAQQLAAFPDPPAFNTAVVNCDASELAAGSCIAMDGSTVLTVDDVPGRGDRPVAEVPVPMAIRPRSNFYWRADPRQLNGDGGHRLNPGGDFRGAYWLGRLLLASSDNNANISSIARNRDGTGGPMVPGGDAGLAWADATHDATPVRYDAGVEADATVAPDAATVIRDAVAAADTANPDNQSGPDVPVLDAGAVDTAAEADSGTDSATHQVSGCGCQINPSSSTLLPAFLLLLAVLRRRR